MQSFRVGGNLILCIDPPPDMLEAAIPSGDAAGADLGKSLLELFSHVADTLSYYQDQVASESFLGTARKRMCVTLAGALARLISQAALLEERLLRLFADMPDVRPV